MSSFFAKKLDGLCVPLVERASTAHHKHPTRAARPRLPEMHIPDRKYGDIANDLGECVSYLTRLGVGPLYRMRHALANIREIERVCSQGRAAALELERDPRLPELIWSLVEGAEFSEIFRGIQGYDEAVVKRLMRKVVNGPLDPRMETQNSNEARNTLFELRLGAALRTAGASVTLGGLRGSRCRSCGISPLRRVQAAAQRTQHSPKSKRSVLPVARAVRRRFTS